ncbi:MAG: hypothetical protein HRU41_22855 [Saprospiraceae bacterium]|nr:hypothetical protein [Saprospiraceae bacterium]
MGILENPIPRRIKLSTAVAWFITSTPKGELYAHTSLEVIKIIDPDSSWSYGGTIDRVGHNYRLEANERKDLLVKIRDVMEMDITPDTISFYFSYYRDARPLDLQNLKVSVPVKSQLNQ